MTTTSRQSLKFSAHLGYLFTELPFADRLNAARDVGFCAVEYPVPYDVPATTMAALLNDAGLPYVQFGLRSGDAARGEKGIAILPDRRNEFRASVVEGLTYADKIGVRMVHAMAGILPATDRLAEHRQCYYENLRFAADEGANYGMTILVEAMSPAAVPDYFLSTAQEAVTAVRAVAHPDVRLLLDVYHTVSVNEDPVAIILENADLISHIHIADTQGRHEPGSGTIDFASIYDALEKVRYDGFIGCEYKPESSTSAGLGWMAAHRSIGRSKRL